MRPLLQRPIRKDLILVSSLIVAASTLLGLAALPRTASASGPVAGAYGPGEIQSAYNLPNWTSGSNPIPSSLYRHSSTVANGYLFLIGGNDGNGPVSTVYSAPVSSSGNVGAWRNLASTPLPKALQDHRTIFASNHLLVIGGTDGTTAVSTVYSAPVNSDGTLGSWTNLTMTPLPVALYGHDAVVASGHVIVTGGATASAPTTPLNTIFIAAINPDGSLGQWVVNPASMPKGLRRHSTVASSGFLVITGGDDASGVPSNGVYSAPITPTGTVGAVIQQLASLPVALDSHRAANYGSYIILTGGYTSGPALGSSAVYYAPINSANGVIGASTCLTSQVQCWTTSYNQLPQPLAEHGLVIAGGALVVTGGFNASVGQFARSVSVVPANVVSGTTRSGAPATVAVVFSHDDPNLESDLQVYRSYFNLPACTTSNGCFKKVYENLGPQVPTASADEASEWSLDVEMVSAACPNCHILVVEAQSAVNTDLGQSENTAANYGSTDPSFAPIAITNSYGQSEFSNEASPPFSTYFNHPGIAITAAAGNGGYCSAASNCPPRGGVLWPAADPNVIAVGGTYLTFSAGWSQAVWNNNNPQTASATSSGCSLYEPKPVWQTGVTDAACPMRMVADVSAVADGPQDLAHFNTFQDSGWVKGYGTSAASPVVAGTIALSGDAITPSYLYHHSSWLHDISGGTNVTSYGNCGNPGNVAYYLCNGVAGYDGPSGLGTLSGLSLVVGQPFSTCTSPPLPAGTGPPSSQVTVLSGVSSVDQFHAWAVGYSGSGSIASDVGIIVATGDGGTTWRSEAVPGGVSRLNGVFFINGCMGWAVGYYYSAAGRWSPVILSTMNAGIAWSLQAAPIAPTGGQTQLMGVKFVDATHGWATGFTTPDSTGNMIGLVLATVDGGVTWSQQTLPPDTLRLWGIAFADPMVGWTVGITHRSGQILKTSDGGNTWVAQATPPSAYILFGVSFITPSTGWAVGRDTGNNRLILGTTDGGATWTSESVPAGLGGVWSVSFANASDGWAAGWDDLGGGGAAGRMLVTKDGGLTWSSQSVPSAVFLYGVSFADSSDGWTVGYTGTFGYAIDGTITGGASWSLQSIH